jgi:hypothetical protein
MAKFLGLAVMGGRTSIFTSILSQGLVMKKSIEFGELMLILQVILFIALLVSVFCRLLNL